MSVSLSCCVRVHSPQALNFYDSQGPPALRPSVTITYSTPNIIKVPNNGPIKGAEADSGSGSASGSEEDTRAFGDDVYASGTPEVQQPEEQGW